MATQASRYARSLDRTMAGTRSDPRYQAFVLMWIVFAVAPIIAGADKFLGLLANWEDYLAPQFPELLGISAGSFMMIVGAVEIVAGLLVAFQPRFGYLVSAWLLGIILNLLLLGDYYDIALRDFGLAVGAFALARQAQGWNAGLGFGRRVYR